MASYRELVGILGAVLRAVQAGMMSPDGSIFHTATRLLAEAQAGRNSETRWTPLENRTALPRPPATEEQIKRIMEASGQTRADVLAAIQQEEAENWEVFANNRYQVLRRSIGGDMVHLSIKRIDQEQIRSWRDLQRIKNEPVGPECEGIEIYPAESRLVDTANQYHLFVLTDPTKRIPMGFDDGRVVLDDLQLGEGQAPLDRP
jgi:hypothetical protein